MITIVRGESFRKYEVQSGGQDYNLPRRDVEALYGPGWPVTPVTRPEDSELPREIDYPVAINATLQPRIGFGQMPVAALLSAYNNIIECSIPVNIIIRELAAFTPTLRDKKTKTRAAEDHPYNWMTVSPDRTSPFNVWLTRYKKSAKVFAAPAFFMRRSNGVVTAMEYIDGSTLFLIVNERGRLPEPDEVDPELMRRVKQLQNAASAKAWRSEAQRGGPTLDRGIFGKMKETHGIKMFAADYFAKAQARADKGQSLPLTTPAFTQIIKGIPFSFWDKDQVYFMPEPPSSATSSPYGESYIERAWSWVQIVAVLTAFELGHYRTGNMPEGFATMPKDWFPNMGKLALAEREFNARMSEGTQTQHSRIRFGPDGMKWIPTKKPDFQDKLYQQARDNIALSLGVPPSELGIKPGKGLGGAGFETGAAHDVTRQLLENEKAALENAFNTVLLKDDVDDVEFYMDYPQEEVDPSKQQENMWNQFTHGTMTLNDILTAQDKEIIGDEDDEDNIANMHIIIAGQSIYVVEKMKAGDTGVVSPPAGAQPNQDGASPAGPEGDAANQHQPGDKDKAKAIAQALEQSGGRSIDGKKTFGPNGKRPAVQKADSDLTLPLLDGPVDAETARRIWSEVVQPGEAEPDETLLEQFRQGLEEEQEHAATVQNDTRTMALIVLDHLKEDSRYYSHLKKNWRAERVDGKWRIRNTDTGKLEPWEHSSESGAQAQVRALYENVPDVRKADITDHDGAMVAVMMPQTVAEHLRSIADELKLPEDARLELPENMHITLAFMPDTAAAEGKKDDITDELRTIAAGYGPLQCKVQGFGVFNGDGREHVLFAMLDCPELPHLRESVTGSLTMRGVKYAQDHGFVPHITLAYFPDDWQVPKGFAVPDIEVTIREVTLCLGEERTHFALSGKPMQKVDWGEYGKHCGVCPEDKEYFGAPVAREVKFVLPTDDPHANEVEMVGMNPGGGLEVKPALWKPEGGENEHLQEAIGGAQYVREEAAWLLDQCLGFQMVPLAYVATLKNGEQGAVVWYTSGRTQVKDPDQYAPEWIERAAVLDYIMSQQDRGFHHNYLTHPDDPERIILIDNGYSFPVDEDRYCRSPFCAQMLNRPLSEATVQAIELCLGDTSMWRDIQDVLADGGTLENAKAAVEKARTCAQRLVNEGMITPEPTGD